MVRDRAENRPLGVPSVIARGRTPRANPDQSTLILLYLQCGKVRNGELSSRLFQVSRCSNKYERCQAESLESARFFDEIRCSWQNMCRELQHQHRRLYFLVPVCLASG